MVDPSRKWLLLIHAYNKDGDLLFARVITALADITGLDCIALLLSNLHRYIKEMKRENQTEDQLICSIRERMIQLLPEIPAFFDKRYLPVHSIHIMSIVPYKD